MFLLNLLITYRNFKKSKLTFFVNVIGLSTGLTCFLLIYLWINFELNVDKFHDNDGQLYQVMENQTLDSRIETTDGTSGLLAEALVEEIPEIEYAATVTPTSWFPKVTLSDKEKSVKATGQFVGVDFFRIFSYKLLYGDRKNVLLDIKSIVISEELAKKLFESPEKAMGQVIDWKWQDFNEEYLITGIFKSNSTSSTQFEYVIPFTWLKENFSHVAQWGNYGPNTFITVKEDAKVDQLNKKLANFMDKRIANSNRTLFVRSYSEAYLHNKYVNGVQTGGRIEYVKLFLIIAIFILVIACINFMNLSTAKASGKIKEVGIKKAIGAGRSTLIYQYLVESTVMAFLSLGIALLLVVLVIPEFNYITGKQLTFNLTVELILVVFGATLFTGLIAGSYPAFYLSGFNPAVVLKGTFKTSVGELWIRKGLVIFQFAISVILIVSVLVTYKQIEFVQTQNLGYQRDNLIYFEKEGRVAENLDTFIEELKNISGIVNASAIAQSIVGTSQSNTMGVEWPGKEPDQMVQFFNVGVHYGLIETLGIEMKLGRSYSKQFGSEDSKIIFNEAAIETMGLNDPIGKVIRLWGEDLQIIGVVKNFNNQSLHEVVKPMFLKLSPDNIMGIMVRIQGVNQKETIQNLQKYYESYNAGYTFDYNFLSDDYEAQYIMENRVASLSRYFAGIAMLISCLGLFGLAAFSSERRFKEIGIRKSLGSSDFKIILLLSKDFTKTVLISIAIALPISYLMTKGWLDGFAYRIDLKIGYFLFAGLLAMLVTWLTIGFQAVKATKINVVKCLRVGN
jgi:putative ABC transport system permease protein